MDEADLRNVVAYANRNPLAAGMVASEAALARFAWCGHGALLGVRAARSFESPEATLALFGADVAIARARLSEWMLRSDSPRNVRPAVPELVSSKEPPAASWNGGKAALGELVQRVCAESGVPPDALHGGWRGGALAKVRAEIAYRATRVVSRLLGISASAVSRAATRFESGRRRPFASATQ